MCRSVAWGGRVGGCFICAWGAQWSFDVRALMKRAGLWAQEKDSTWQVQSMADRGHGCMQCGKWMVWLCRFSGFIRGVSCVACKCSSLGCVYGSMCLRHSFKRVLENQCLLKSYRRLVSFGIKVKINDSLLNRYRCTSLFQWDVVRDLLPRLDWQGGKGHSAWNTQ